MSVAEFTISYIARPTYSLKEKLEEQNFSISLSRRRIAFMCLLASLVLLTASYLFTAGVIVTLNIESAALQDRLERALISANEAEANFIRINNLKGVDFFAEAGFAKPAGIGVIERSTNVVEGAYSRALY